MPGEAGANIHAGELESMDREPGHLLLVHLKLDGHALVDLVRHDGAADGGHLLRTQHADVHQLGEGRVERFAVSHLLPDQFDVEGRLVVGEYHAVAVEYQAAARRNGLDADPIALGEVGVVLVLDDLEIEQPPGDAQKQHQRDDARHDAPHHEESILGVVILDPGLAACHGPEILQQRTGRD